jgi:sn-glycerol 3-phosphate transport system ATP-binding protein/multiple sugar transport system ATP-binding protein
MVFQSYALYPHLSVRDNLAFGLRLRKTDEAEIARRVVEAAEILELGALLDRLPKALSGGQRQRVAMGRAIVRRPSLFLFDEPLSNLDAALRAQVRVQIRSLHDRLGATSVYVTHDQVEAMTLADVLFVLNRGVVEQCGAPLEVYARPATRFVASFLGSPAINFMHASLERRADRWFAACRGGPTLALDVAEAGSGLEPGGAAVIGIRPHDVEPAPAEGERTATLEVDLVEALGAESFAHGKVGTVPFVARLEPETRVEKGARVALRVKRVHIFDAESGVALR